MPEVASAEKVLYHREKIAGYLEGRPVFPATLELDITGSCTRRCAGCPSNRGLGKARLKLGSIRDLFSWLEGQTRGLLLSGGEPTMSPIFPEVLQLARSRGFADIAVVTNGSLLGDRAVQDALLAYASTIRVSLYDWDADSIEGILETLRRIERLRARVDAEASPLRLGVSALTSTPRTGVLQEVARTVRDAGAHWLYFHPTCTNWEAGRPGQVQQQGVPQAIDACRASYGGDFAVYALRDRYRRSALDFAAYHGAHFLLVIGADGLNYLGAEVKYHPDYVIADATGDRDSSFLQRPHRLERIRAFNAGAYGAIHSRHRGALYSHVIQRLLEGEAWPPANASFLFPHVL